ncbi:MAG: hypothetical protein K940chlam1_00404 [Candidatus Anoxychlamydiales bacterium]|nr:hypothetical protein [Candidatus Anoxychlamydiales bacterium]NGX36305.1 hypothetical protein [Candidatus Anoxychlamydiales bacterium]
MGNIKSLSTMNPEEKVYKLTQGKKDFLIFSNDEKITSSAKDPFKNLEIFCLDCLNKKNIPINNTFNPIIEVKPHIQVNNSDSMKKKIFTLIAGALLGVVTMKYGFSIGSKIINQPNLGIANKIHQLTGYFQSLNLFETENNRSNPIQQSQNNTTHFFQKNPRVVVRKHFLNHKSY